MHNTNLVSCETTIYGVVNSYEFVQFIHSTLCSLIWSVWSLIQYMVDLFDIYLQTPHSTRELHLKSQNKTHYLCNTAIFSTQPSWRAEAATHTTLFASYNSVKIISGWDVCFLYLIIFLFFLGKAISQDTIICQCVSTLCDILPKTPSLQEDTRLL